MYECELKKVCTGGRWHKPIEPDLACAAISLLLHMASQSGLGAQHYTRSWRCIPCLHPGTRGSSNLRLRAVHTCAKPAKWQWPCTATYTLRHKHACTSTHSSMHMHTYKWDQAASNCTVMQLFSPAFLFLICQIVCVCVYVCVLCVC